MSRTTILWKLFTTSYQPNYWNRYKSEGFSVNTICFFLKVRQLKQNKLNLVEYKLILVKLVIC